MASVPANVLKLVLFPTCSNKCAALELLGAGECDSVCPYKFDGTGEPRMFTEEDANKYWQAREVKSCET